MHKRRSVPRSGRSHAPRRQRRCFRPMPSGFALSADHISLDRSAALVVAPRLDFFLSVLFALYRSRIRRLSNSLADFLEHINGIWIHRAILIDTEVDRHRTAVGLAPINVIPQ